jgi:tricorn protease
MPFPISTYRLTPDSRTIVFVTSEPAGTANLPVIYSIQDDGRRLSRITSGQPPNAEGEGGPVGGGGFGGGISELNISRDGRTLFFRERDGIYSVPLSAATAAAGATAGAREAGRRRINFNVRVRVDRSAEWSEMFDELANDEIRYDQRCRHGLCNAAKYQPLGDSLANVRTLHHQRNDRRAERIPHRSGPRRAVQAVAELCPSGLELEADNTAGRYRVTHVYEDGPQIKTGFASKRRLSHRHQWKPVKAGDDYWALLNNRLNRKVEVTFNNKPAEDGAWHPGSRRFDEHIASFDMTVGVNAARRWTNFQAVASVTFISRR